MPLIAQRTFPMSSHPPTLHPQAKRAMKCIHIFLFTMHITQKRVKVTKYTYIFVSGPLAFFHDLSLGWKAYEG